MVTHSRPLLIAIADTHQFKKENTDIVLIPQPSDDPNDPLNWPKQKKALAFLSIVFYAYAVTWVLGGIAFGIPLMMADLNIDLNAAVTGLISWVVLTLGIGVSPHNTHTNSRTSSGLPQRFISEKDPSSFSFRWSRLQGPFGVLKQIVITV
jgi:hypothetical protein